MSLPGIDAGSESLYSVLGLSIKEKSTNDVVFTYPCSVECLDCVPKLGLSVDPIMLDTDTGSSTTFSTKAFGLIPNQLYSYEFKTVDGNWPLNVVPQSGYIQTPNNEYEIKSLISICRTRALCGNGGVGISGFPEELETCYNNQELYSLLEVNLSSINTTYQTPTKGSIPVVCDDCINKLSASLPTLIELTERSANKTAFTAEINNLIPGAEYSYTFKGVDSNWPSTLYPISGSFVASSKDVKIPAKLTFCHSTGVCPKTNSDVLDYAVDGACSYDLGDFDKVSRIKLEVNQLDCNNQISTTSNELTVICDDCVPKTRATLPRTGALNRATQNTTTFIANLTNLVEGSEYKYSFMGVDSNWPTTVYPMSGIIRAVSSSVDIPVQVAFCRAPDLCDPAEINNVLPYEANPDFSFRLDTDRYTRLNLKVESVGCGTDQIISNDMLLTCVDCLPELVINHSSPSETLSGAGNNLYKLGTTISNLVPGERYEYNVNYLDSNWPTVVSKQSGEFLAVSTTKNIQTDMAFCFPSGACALDRRDTFINYRSNSIYKNSTTKFLNISMSVSTKDLETPMSTSQDFSLVCDGCLPSTNFNVKVSGSPILTLASGCCTGARLVSTNITGAIPGELHTYSFSCVNPDVYFSPASGTITLRSGGNGTIMSLMTTNLENKEQAIVECKVVNTVSDLETVDFLVVRCGPECTN